MIDRDMTAEQLTVMVRNLCTPDVARVFANFAYSRYYSCLNATGASNETNEWWLAWRAAQRRERELWEEARRRAASGGSGE